MWILKSGQKPSWCGCRVLGLMAGLSDTATTQYNNNIFTSCMKSYTRQENENSKQMWAGNPVDRGTCFNSKKLLLFRNCCRTRQITCPLFFCRCFSIIVWRRCCIIWRVSPAVSLVIKPFYLQDSLSQRDWLNRRLTAVVYSQQDCVSGLVFARAYHLFEGCCFFAPSKGCTAPWFSFFPLESVKNKYIVLN